MLAYGFGDKKYIIPNKKYEDISINNHDELAFMTPYSDDCKEYLYSVTSEELWKVVRELDNTDDGYKFYLYDNGYVQYLSPKAKFPF